MAPAPIITYASHSFQFPQSFQLSSLVTTCTDQITNARTLREFVELALCEHLLLEIGAFPITERTLLRGGKPCGIMFCLHGPRATKFTAIWETDRNQILFYGENGERFNRIQLPEEIAA